jgi:phosphoglycerate dehydrogenase-like enzyme
MAEIFRIALDRGFVDSSGKTLWPDLGLGPLDQSPDVTYEFLTEATAELTSAQIAPYHGLILGGPKVTARTLAGGAERLVVIARHGVGYDQIDVDALTAHDVALCTTPAASKHPVAAASFAYLMALAKQLVAKDRLVRSGRWDRRGQYCGNEILGKTLGLIGLGNTGSELVRLVAPFGMRVVVHDPYVSAEDARKLGVSLVDLDEVFRQADFVCVHAKLTSETRGLVGARQFALMKPTAYFINVARGPIVDQRALAVALRERRLAGAGLDVFEEEPLPLDDPLLDLDNVMLSPHTAAHTLELSIAMGNINSEQLLAAAHGQVPRDVVNREVLERPGFQAKLRRWARG